MGGTNSAENLVEITVTQHAMYHFCNYKLWGNEEDKIAWRMLGKQITLDEAKLEAVRLGGKRGNRTIKEKLKDPDKLNEYRKKCKESFNNSPHREEMINRAKLNQSKAMEASKTPEARKKCKEKLFIIEHNKGEKNPQYGKMWITNGTKEGTYRINKGESIPEGYWKGRICFDVKPKGKTASAYGRIWINDGFKNKMIPKELPIPEGYSKGRISK
jgi:hypothetical protein